MTVDPLKLAKIIERAEGLEQWLRENGPEACVEQKHCEEGTQERIYWHYGYMVALRDVLQQIATVN